MYILEATMSCAKYSVLYIHILSWLLRQLLISFRRILFVWLNNCGFQNQQLLTGRILRMFLFASCAQPPSMEDKVTWNKIKQIVTFILICVYTHAYNIHIQRAVWLKRLPICLCIRVISSKCHVRTALVKVYWFALSMFVTLESVRWKHLVNTSGHISSGLYFHGWYWPNHPISTTLSLYPWLYHQVTCCVMLATWANVKHVTLLCLPCWTCPPLM